MLTTVGYVNGIENYSRILDGRQPGSRPHSLIDFFKKPFLTIIDESHASIPQIRGMYNGDKARKTTLVEHGFRIPSALDNRPLTFGEFEQIRDFVMYSSATPGDYEFLQCDGVFTEQVIRPTGLVDPPVTIKPAINQIDDLIEELRVIVEKNQRALITTLTKKMAEDLTDYLESLQFKARYLHSEIQTLERPEILRKLREGEFDILIGINLLREGLDLPEVTLVAILDADREGFLRSHRSIIQIAGRAARNVEGKIILYADTITDSIRKAIEETTRRRQKQIEYNTSHNIIPKTTIRKMAVPISLYMDERIREPSSVTETPDTYYDDLFFNPEDRAAIEKEIKDLEKEMSKAAKQLQFEKAAGIRDSITDLKRKLGS
jgi:excinuclease ABC subunit B